MGGGQCQLHNLLNQRHLRSKLHFCTLESRQDPLGFPVAPAPVPASPSALRWSWPLGPGPQLLGWLEGSGGATLGLGPPLVSARLWEGLPHTSGGWAVLGLLPLVVPTPPFSAASGASPVPGPPPTPTSSPPFDDLGSMRLHQRAGGPPSSPRGPVPASPAVGRVYARGGTGLGGWASGVANTTGLAGVWLLGLVLAGGPGILGLESWGLWPPPGPISERPWQPAPGPGQAPSGPGL